jgi:hypothetical protein
VLTVPIRVASAMIVKAVVRGARRQPGDGAERLVAGGVRAAAGLQAPATARHLVGELLRGWGLAAIIDDAELAVSEIVANAVQHAGIWQPPRRGRPRIRQGAWLGDRRLTGAAYRAADRDQPAARTRAAHRCRPRRRLGTELLEGGKRVWVEVAVPASNLEPARSSTTGAAPEVLGFPAVAMTDQGLPPAVLGPPDGGRSAAGDALPMPE